MLWKTALIGGFQGGTGGRMSKKIEKVREDIRKAEARVREADEYLKTLRAKERQLEDEEIVAQIRSMQEKGADILDVLRVVKGRKDRQGRENENVRGGENRGI